jgi:hypothetical protein
MVDQGVSSLSNVLVSVFVARSLPAEGFGAFGVAVIAYLLTLGTGRALVGEPLLSQHSEASPAERERLVPHMIGAAAVAGAVAAALVAVIGIVSGGASGSALTALAVVLPLMIVQDAWRYAFIIDRPGAALTVDVVWLLGVCVVLPLAPHAARPAWFVVAWGLTSGFGVLAGWVMTRNSFFLPRPGRWFADHREMGSRFLGEFITGQAVSQLILVGLGAMAGLAELGAVRAAQVFYGPINTVHSGAYLALVPEGAQAAARPSRMRRLMALASVGLCVISLCWMLVGLALPDSWGAALFGPTWAEAGDLLVPMGLAMVAGSLVTGGFAGVRSLGAARDSLRARLRSVPALLVLPLVGAAVANGRGYAAGLGAAQLVTAIIWWSAFLRALARRTTRARARAVLEAVSG